MGNWIATHELAAALSIDTGLVTAAVASQLSHAGWHHKITFVVKLWSTAIALCVLGHFLVACFPWETEMSLGKLTPILLIAIGVQTLRGPVMAVDSGIGDEVTGVRSVLIAIIAGLDASIAGAAYAITGSPLPALLIALTLWSAAASAIGIGLATAIQLRCQSDITGWAGCICISAGCMQLLA